MPLIRKSPESAATRPDGDDPIQALRTGSVDERFAAARSLSAQGDAVEALSAVLATESDARVREAILTGLARVGNAESAKAILPLIRSDDASIRTAALDALRLMPQAVAAHLSALLADGDPDVRLLACDLARYLPGPLATRLICDLLADESEPNVCATALDVLAEVGAPEALPVLARCRERFSDLPFLSFAIRIATDRISAKSP